MRKMAPVLIVLMFALSACGGGGDAKNSSDAKSSAGGDAKTVSDLTKCSDVWVVGKTLPADYEEGCVEGDTQLDTASTPCADGKTSLFIHQTETGKNTHLAITGLKIQAYAEDAYSKAYDVCQPSN